MPSKRHRPFVRPDQAPSHRFTLFVIGLMAFVWVIAALVRPGTTLHLGPLILPMIPLATVPNEETPLALIGVGAGVGALVILVLGLAGLLNGPALEPFSSALAESVVVLVGASVFSAGFTLITP